MKKCASCSKDLPDAALHCVFCGAKQSSSPPPAAGASAKTVMGSFSASDMIQHLKQSGGVPAQPPAPTALSPAVTSPVAASPPASSPYAPPADAAPPSPYAPRPQSPSHPPALSGPPSMPPPARPSVPPASSHGVPAAPAQAPTMIAQAPPGSLGPAAAGGGPSASAWAPPATATAPASDLVATPPGAYAVAPPAPYVPPIAVAPAAAIPSASPYTASDRAHTARPVEPWRDQLRMLMLIFGALTIAFFVVPRTMEPLTFGFEEILDGTGTARVRPLLDGALGLFGVLLAFVPMPASARGVLAGLLGVACLVAPQLVRGMSSDVPWQLLVQLGAMLFLVPGLVLRSQYRDALLPRVLVTIGVLAFLATMLVPDRDKLPVLELLETALDGSDALRAPAVVLLVQTLVIVLCLLVWLPAPGTGGAIVWAWLLMLFPLLFQAASVMLATEIMDSITSAPARLLLAWVPSTTALVFLGYGWATVLGKQLE